MTDKYSSEPAQKVDVKAVFYSKNSRLAKLLPGFIFRYLKRIVHEDDINAFLEKHGQKLDLEFIDAAIEDFSVTLETYGEENIPRNDKLIFAANHPLGGFDGIILMKIISRHFDSFRFLVNDILMNISNIRGLFIPINKHGSLALQAARLIDDTFRSDTQILTFPAGLVSRRIKGKITDLTWKKSFITKAVEFKRNVIPVHFSGGNSNFFYNFSNIRTRLGIKANIEMLYLANETYKHRNKKLVVKFGKPISYQTFDRSKKPIEWAQWVKEKVYELDAGVMKQPETV